MFKLKFTLVILIVSFNLSLYSQAIDAGLKLGVSASQVSGDSYGGFNKAGLIFGGFAKINLKDKHHVQFEITYTQKGSRRNPKTSEGDNDFFLLRLDYIEIPLLYQYDYKIFTFEGGPYISTLINQYIEDEFGVTTLPDNYNEFSAFDIGVTAGLSFNFTEHLIMSWRYSNSVIPVRKFESEAILNNLAVGAGGIDSFNAGMFHSYISFSLNYKFGSKNG